MDILPNTEPTLPEDLVRRLLHLFTAAQLEVLIEHGEEVVCQRRHGEVTITVRDGRVHTIGHQVSDKV